jgi:hypothetical protein
LNTATQHVTRAILLAILVAFAFVPRVESGLRLRSAEQKARRSSQLATDYNDAEFCNCARASIGNVISWLSGPRTDELTSTQRQRFAWTFASFLTNYAKGDFEGYKQYKARIPVHHLRFDGAVTNFMPAQFQASSITSQEQWDVLKIVWESATGASNQAAAARLLSVATNSIRVYPSKIVSKAQLLQFQPLSGLGITTVFPCDTIFDYGINSAEGLLEAHRELELLDVLFLARTSAVPSRGTFFFLRYHWAPTLADWVPDSLAFDSTQGPSFKVLY